MSGGFVLLAAALEVPRQRTGSKELRVKIYALFDPRDRRVRYVGRTSRSLAARLALHLEKPTNYSMARWFDELRSAGLCPDVTTLEHVADEEWEAAERGWIAWFRKRGRLLNIDLGGNHRDGMGRPRGEFEGTFLEPQKASKPVVDRRKYVSGGDRWERLLRPMPGHGLHETRKSPGGRASGHGGSKRMGDPGIDL